MRSKTDTHSEEAEKAVYTGQLIAIGLVPALKETVAHHLSEFYMLESSTVQKNKGACNESSTTVVRVVFPERGALGARGTKQPWSDHSGSACIQCAGIWASFAFGNRVGV
jgi:hypothetical protein